MQKGGSQVEFLDISTITCMYSSVRRGLLEHPKNRAGYATDEERQHENWASTNQSQVGDLYTIVS